MASKDIGTLRTKLSWEDEGSSKGITGFQSDLKSLRAEMAVATSKGADYKNSLKGLGEQSDILTRRFKTQKEQVEELKKRYEESVRVKGEDDKQTKNLADQYNNAVAAMNRTEQQLDKVTDAIKAQKDPWKQLSESMTSTGERMQEVGKSMTDFGKSYSMRVTAPIVAGGVAAFKMASDYESAFAGVAKTFSGTEEQLASLRVGIREMAKEIPASTTEIAAVAEAAGQLGIKAEAIEGFTRTMIDLGVATNMTSDQAATEFARFANIVSMSQKDFDRLGSSTVALGNSMATTEGEIVTMSLRLAAQGKQVGMTEADILALAATMSSLGIEAEAGGSAMTMVLKKIQSAVMTGGEFLNHFAKAAGSSAEEFAKVWYENPIAALDMFTKGLGKSSEAGENLSEILRYLGIKGIREQDVLLRMAGATDILSEAVNTSSVAWKENVALTNEASQRYATTESQLVMMRNRLKDVGITLGEALIPAVMSALKAAEPFIAQIESGAKAFSDMDEEQQRTILKLIGLVAAIGPASIALGGLTTTVGGVLKVGGSLTGMLGKTGGAGLLGRFGLMGVSGGPVGLAIAGTAALALGIYAVNKATYESVESTLKSIESREKEIDSLDGLIASFETLRGKNKLTSDEVLRYMDIMSELKDAKTEEGIKKLTDEQTRLQEKSGLTNEEMAKFLELNGKIVEKAPETSKAISEQGNAYAVVLEEIKMLNAEERSRVLADTYTLLSKELLNQEGLLTNQKKLTEAIKKDERERSKANADVTTAVGKLNEKNIELAKLRERASKATGEELEKLNSMIKMGEQEVAVLDGKVFQHQRAADKIDKQIEKKQKSLEETNKELKAFDALQAKYEQLILSEVGLTSEKGKGFAKLNESSKTIDGQITKLRELKKVQGDSTGELQEQINKLEAQKKKIDEAKDKMKALNEEARRTVYKDILLRTSPTPETLNRYLAETVSKNINVVTQRASGPRAYAKGTDYHPGGPFLAGEEGFELGRMGNRWDLLKFGMHTRPAGYEVFTHDESKNILSALNRMPGYAKGVSPNGEAERITKRLNQTNQPVSQSFNIEPAPVILDGRVIGEVVFNVVDGMQSDRTRMTALTTGVIL